MSFHYEPPRGFACLFIWVESRGWARPLPGVPDLLPACGGTAAVPAAGLGARGGGLRRSSASYRISTRGSGGLRQCCDAPEPNKMTRMSGLKKGAQDTR